MGRTVPSYRLALNQELGSWAEFRRGLSPEDREYFDEIATMARQHADASSLAARPIMSENVFMSVLVSLLKRVRELEKKEAISQQDARTVAGISSSEK